MCTVCCNALAQKKNERRRSDNTNYTTSMDSNGKTMENIHTVVDNTAYKIAMTDEKITALYVDGKLIPPEQYGQYETVIVKIKEQMRLDRIQAKKDGEQAVKDQIQAKLDQEQAAKDQRQAKLDDEKASEARINAKLDMERANKDQQQAKLDQEQAAKDQRQAKLDDEKASEGRINAKLDMERANKDQQQAKLDQEQAAKDQRQAKLGDEKASEARINAKLDMERANKDQQQAKLDQEQAMKDQAQAKLDQQQAEEDQKLVKQLVADIVKDGIVADEKNVLSVTLSAEGMTVNDKKQPGDVYRKYKEKYSRFSTGNFNYSNSPDGKRIQMHRPSR